MVSAGGGGDAWRLSLPGRPRSVPAVQQLCAAFDRPGLRCGLDGQVELSVRPPAVRRAAATPEALRTYLGCCAEVAGRLQSGGAGRFRGSGVLLTLGVGDGAGVDNDEAFADPAFAQQAFAFFGRVLGAVLPAAAPHVRSLHLRPESGFFPTGWSRHLAAPGVAFPLLERLELDNGDVDGRHLSASDVAALARVTAPRLTDVGLLSPAIGAQDVGVGGVFDEASWPGAGPCRAEMAVLALAMGLPRPVDAEGRPTRRTIQVGCGPPKDKQGFHDTLVAAGRGGWTDVRWEPEDEDIDESTDDSTGPY